MYRQVILLISGIAVSSLAGAWTLTNKTAYPYLGGGGTANVSTGQTITGSPSQLVSGGAYGSVTSGTTIYSCYFQPGINAVDWTKSDVKIYVAKTACSDSVNIPPRLCCTNSIQVNSGGATTVKK